MLTDKAKEIVASATAKMQDALDFLEEDLKTYRVGKANPSVFNNVTVDYYGSQAPISQVASVTAPDARTIAIQPWEKSMIPVIEKAIMVANLGFTPQNNGEVVRISIPPLSEERRKDMVKKCRAEGENAKVVIRNTRRDANEEIKKLSKDKVLPEDAAKQAEKDIQDQTDKFVARVDGILAEKEKDIMTV